VTLHHIKTLVSVHQHNTIVHLHLSTLHLSPSRPVSSLLFPSLLPTQEGTGCNPGGLHWLQDQQCCGVLVQSVISLHLYAEESLCF